MILLNMIKMLTFVIFLVISLFAFSLCNENKCECVSKTVCSPPFYKVNDGQCSEANTVCCSRVVRRTSDNNYNVTAGLVKIMLNQELHMEHIGSGILVYPGIVLTVAHIVARRGIRPYDMNVDYQSTRNRNVSATYVEPRYNPEVMLADLALLVMLPDKNKTHAVEGVARFQEATINTKSCVLATSHKGNGLHTVDMQLVTQSSCEKFVREHGLAPWYHLPNDLLCAVPTNPKVDIACKVDPGAPLFCNSTNAGPLKLVGVASWTLRACEEDIVYPIVFTSVANQRDWLDQILSVYNPLRATFI